MGVEARAGHYVTGQHGKSGMMEVGKIGTTDKHTRESERRGEKQRERESERREREKERDKAQGGGRRMPAASSQ